MNDVMKKQFSTEEVCEYFEDYSSMCSQFSGVSNSQVTQLCAIFKNRVMIDAQRIICQQTFAEADQKTYDSLVEQRQELHDTFVRMRIGA